MKFIVFAVMFVASITFNMVNIPEETYSIELTKQEIIQQVRKKITENQDQFDSDNPIELVVTNAIPDKNLFSFHIYSDIFYPPQFKPPIA
jgi:hypothetical protein